MPGKSNLFIAPVDPDSPPFRSLKSEVRSRRDSDSWLLISETWMVEAPGSATRVRIAYSKQPFIAIAVPSFSNIARFAAKGNP